MTQFYQTLLRLNPRSLAVEPELGQKWEQPSETQYVFTLNPGVKWHNKPPLNGRALTADDIVFSLNRVRTDEPRFQNRQLLASIDKIEAVNASTVRVTTRRPDVSTLTNLAAYSVAILAREVMEKNDKLTTPDTAVGTGAFMLTELDDTHSAVVRNPDYWKPGLPYLDGIRNQFFGDDATAWAAFLAKQIDFASNPVSGPEAKKLFDEQEGKAYTGEWYKDVSYTSAQPNLRRKPFDDARVTRALRLMLDHEEATNEWGLTWFGRGYLLSYLPAALDEWDFTEQEYITRFLEYKRPKDEAAREAIRLLNAAGFTRDNPLRFILHSTDSPFSRAMAELYQSQVNKFAQGSVNITEVRPTVLAQLNQIQAQGEFDYSLSNVVAPQPNDVDSWFTTLYVTNGGRNNGKMSDARLDGMIDRQRAIFNVADRKAYVKEMLTYMIENIPYTGWSGRYVLNVGSSRLHDWAPEGASAMWGYNYEQVWLDA
jgi:peptide/nickel transport system substrate-binding protein